MKKWSCALSLTSVAVVLLNTSVWAQNLSFAPRVFVGAIYQGGDSDSWTGSVTASNPTCTLSVPNNSPGALDGVGPNGILLTGSSECPGMFELVLSNGTPFNALPSAGGIDNFTGVYGGKFAIVSTNDFSKQGQTVVWAGNYTQVFNIDPRGSSPFFCGALSFCANLGPGFGSETFNGSGLSFLLELNGFTWNVQ